MDIYLDNSATTRICPEAAEKMTYIINNVYGNPSSTHKIGDDAHREFELSRKIVADHLGVDKKELFFTSGGTEANNMAVFGAARARKRLGNRIVTTAAEHSSVFESCKELENEGFEVVYLSPDQSGSVSEEQLRTAIDEKTVLVSMMAVNNETGAFFPIDKVKSIITEKKSPALFHCDAVQAFGKIPVKPGKIKCDLLSVSAHKIHGPKGSGALFVKNGVHIKPILYGGEQQEKLRPGTEALVLIGGFSAAVKALGNISSNYQSVRELHDHAVERLKGLDGVVLNSPENSLPYIINFSALGIKSETMMNFLSSRGIYVSNGSACAKGKKSHVLSAMGLTDERIDSAVRISFSKYSQKNEIDALADALQEGLSTLARAKKR
ncbi:MAG: cysteine desulfurase [Clostridia bacterium]|nr:cysteine desulfurase [Clostridia bacterium]